MENRVTNSISFNTNVRTTEFDDSQQLAALRQNDTAPLLPSGTAVTEQIKQVFNFTTVEAELLHFMEAACQNPTLRSAQEFQQALRKTFENLKQNHGDHPSKAAQVLQQLLEDKQLLDWYRAMIIDN
ncbi:MAG: hypothetical protein K5787_14625 [Lentisphaeria bacterium]|nr:hypothetical protein [Lentisphaeria bacterium]